MYCPIADLNFDSGPGDSLDNNEVCRFDCESCLTFCLIVKEEADDDDYEG